MNSKFLLKKSLNATLSDIIDFKKKSHSKNHKFGKKCRLTYFEFDEHDF